MESNRWSLFDYLHVGVSGFPLDGLVSIDVTCWGNSPPPKGSREEIGKGLDKENQRIS